MEKPILGLGPGSIVQDTYRIEELLGEGGMGATFRAVNLTTRHPVAVKVMTPSFAANRQAVELFRRESTHLRSVQNDAVIRYETTLQDREGRLFLVMEFVDGKTLKHYVARGSRLASRDVLALGLRLAQGLAAIHAMGIVHRDIAPDNIMIPDETVAKAKLIDFGLASDTVGTDKSIIGTGFAGKLDYCAPEQFGLFGNRIGPATDRYALGLVLMKVAGLAVPGEGKGMAAIEDRRLDIKVTSEKVSPGLRRVLETLLRADPAQRGDDLVALFEAAQVEEAKTAKSSKAPKQRTGIAGATGSGGKQALLVAAALVLAAALGGGVWYVWWQGKPAVSSEVETARKTLSADDPLQAVEAQIAAGGSENLNAALAVLLAYARDETRPAANRAEAAMMIARMYDPKTYDVALSPFPEPNAAAARRYYEQAVQLGATGAAEALGRLAQTLSP
jgi:serine/threonine protein kinase